MYYIGKGKSPITFLHKKVISLRKKSKMHQNLALEGIMLLFSFLPGLPALFYFPINVHHNKKYWIINLYALVIDFHSVYWVLE